MLSKSSDVGFIDSEIFTTGQVLCISLHWPSGRVLSGEAEVGWRDRGWIFCVLQLRSIQASEVLSVEHFLFRSSITGITVVCFTLTVFGLLLFWLCLCMTIHIPSPQTFLTIIEFRSRLVCLPGLQQVETLECLVPTKMLLCWVISGKFFLGSSYNIYNVVGGWELNYYVLYVRLSIISYYKRIRSC